MDGGSEGNSHTRKSVIMSTQFQFSAQFNENNCSIGSLRGSYCFILFCFVLYCIVLLFLVFGFKPRGDGGVKGAVVHSVVPQHSRR